MVRPVTVNRAVNWTRKLPPPRGQRVSAIPSPIKLSLEVVEDANQSLQRWLGLKGNNPADGGLGRKLVFTFVELEEGIQESAGVNYADIDVIGRAEAFKNYVGNTNREFSITFKFRAQGLKGDNLADALNREVVLPAKWIDALKFAITDRSGSGGTGIAHPPPRCILQIGQLFTGFVLVTEAQITWMSPFDPDTLLPYGADVSTTLTVVRRRIQNYNFNTGRR